MIMHTFTECVIVCQLSVVHVHYTPRPFHTTLVFQNENGPGDELDIKFFNMGVDLGTTLVFQYGNGLGPADEATCLCTRRYWFYCS